MARSIATTVAVAVLVATCGCKGDAPRPTPTRAATAADATGPGTPFMRFRGARDTTPRVAFGGTPYCHYDVVMRDVVVDLRARPPLMAPDDVAEVRVASRMVESLAAPCPGIEAASPSAHVYIQHGADDVMRGDEGDLILRLAGETTNHPAARLRVRLRFAGEGIVAELRWQRTDQAPPLDWAIAAELTLTPVCAPGAVCP